MQKVMNNILGSPIFSQLRPSLILFGSMTKLPNTDLLNKVLQIDDIRFVPQGAKPRSFAEQYEPRIFLTREVQTRDQSWHDFFNALVWHQLPKTKNAINQIHYQLQKSRFPSKLRLPAENMLTIFDEHGAIVLSSNFQLLELIRQRRWHELFWIRREQVRNELKVVIFGHGLYEKALNPFIGLSTHCIMFHTQGESSVDDLASALLLKRNIDLRTRDLCPLPILGIPGWWDANEDETFYTNKTYFRTSDLQHAPTIQ